MNLSRFFQSISGRAPARDIGSAGPRRGERKVFFMLVEEGTAGPLVRREMGAEEMVEIRDRYARCSGRLSAAGVSLYRHDLVDGGKIWRILNIGEWIDNARSKNCIA